MLAPEKDPELGESLFLPVRMASWAIHILVILTISVTGPDVLWVLALASILIRSVWAHMYFSYPDPHSEEL